MVPVCGSVGRGLRKGTMASVHLSVWEKALPQLLPWCQILQVLPVFHWCLSSCYSGAGAQMVWVWVSPHMGSLMETAWDSRSFFHQPNPCCFFQPEVMGTYLPGPETVGWELLVLGWDSLLLRYPIQIFIYHTWMWDQPIPCLHPSYLSGWMWFL